jgi:hypothetical protein
MVRSASRLRLSGGADDTRDTHENGRVATRRAKSGNSSASGHALDIATREEWSGPTSLHEAPCEPNITQGSLSPQAAWRPTEIRACRG